MEFQKTLKRAFFSIVNISGNLFCKVFFIDFVSEIYLNLNANKYILKGEWSWQKSSHLFIKMLAVFLFRLPWRLSKESPFNVGGLGLIPGMGRYPGGGRGNPLQFSCLESPQGQRNMVGYSPWGHKESDMTEQLSTFSSLSLQILFFFSIPHHFMLIPMSFSGKVAHLL